MSFIKSVLLDIKSKNYSWSQLTFILPSRRAGVHLKNTLSEIIEQPIFSPHIISVESFVEEISGLKVENNIKLLFKLYKAYKANTPKEEQENFEVFYKWGTLLLQDFNEIDRYLINENKLFEYLKAIKDINHWSLQNSKTNMVISYLNFWERLYKYYKTFISELKDNGVGYQGLIYKQAVQLINNFIENNKNQHFVFLGFNALNTCESLIIQKMLSKGIADIYWDIDDHFINDTTHSVGHFIRNYKYNWKYYKTHSFNWITNHYKKEKKITVIGVPKRVNQVKYIGNLLRKINNKNELSNTSVVLGNETLLIPLLSSLPEEISKINVTMGLPLKSIPLATLFEYLLDCHINTNEKIYYKTLLKIITHPSLSPLFEEKHINYAIIISDYIHKNNLIYLSISDLQNIASSKKELISLLFEGWGSIANILSKCNQLILTIKNKLVPSKAKYSLELEYLYRFNQLFNQITLLNNTHTYINNAKSLKNIYKELLNNETLNFKGEPLEGLQIMGMLESRVLDFETVIISDVNEGILPGGKTQNSFIPYDVKIENNLPTYKEKDAVYTYHFYNLISRAKQVFILYNTEVDALKGGEKSRFITQLKAEGIHKIKHYVVAPKISPIKPTLIEIKKTNDVLLKVKEAAKSGLSPSSLTSYIRNPIDFYYKKILRVKDFEAAEEHVASNTFGTIIHNTLEDFYKPLEDTILNIETLQQLKFKINHTITHHFEKLYHKGHITQGKNLIIFEVAKQYILNFINKEIHELKQGNQIKILSIENDESLQLTIKNLNFPIQLNGKIDRVDSYNGTTRIIDYKSGKVTSTNLEIIDWETITTDYKKYSKAFQVLSYVYLMYKNNKITLPVEAGIFSFKNLNDGLLKFAKKESVRGKKNHEITEDTLVTFEKHLKQLIIEICNPNINFIEKEVE